MYNTDWNEKAKRLLKSELIRRGVGSEDLVALLENIGVEETKASIDSKISRGTFSAAFLIQCLNAMGVRSFVPEVDPQMIVSEPIVIYKTRKTKAKAKS
ncbi:hypothetical protein MGMO_26c00210 [Methyloglobulus morosus KoM1]|uniref:DUF6471 domain-containing protein n=1 Tax=Methyloglobulus morosus KoM1 TaxID=1116472 RepID=V5BZQ6_9GAMM|nr:DUF6471 domain-containing protein [Methyloglobulus morosus]ESS73309.1 hypothetical protein MGMO_26c00210 [Methyloglobulus morosus KoM1]